MSTADAPHPPSHRPNASQLLALSSTSPGAGVSWTLAVVPQKEKGDKSQKQETAFWKGRQRRRGASQSNSAHCCGPLSRPALPGGITGAPSGTHALVVASFWSALPNPAGWFLSITGLKGGRKEMGKGEVYLLPPCHKCKALLLDYSAVSAANQFTGHSSLLCFANSSSTKSLGPIPALSLPRNPPRPGQTSCMWQATKRRSSREPPLLRRQRREQAVLELASSSHRTTGALVAPRCLVAHPSFPQDSRAGPPGMRTPEAQKHDYNRAGSYFHFPVMQIMC